MKLQHSTKFASLAILMFLALSLTLACTNDPTPRVTDPLPVSQAIPNETAESINAGANAANSTTNANTPTDQMTTQRNRTDENRAAGLLNPTDSDYGGPGQTSSFRPAGQPYEESSLRPLRSTVNVSGIGATEATPDMATVQMSIEIDDVSIQAARQRAANVADLAQRTLMNLGIPDRDISTSSFSIQPQYDWRDNERFLTGYSVTHSLTVKFRDLEALGSQIDTVSQSAGNDLLFQYLFFGFQDPDSVIALARTDAVQDAHDKALQLATDSGRQLGAILAISEGAAHPPPITFTRSMYNSTDSLGSAAATPITAGDTTIAVAIQATFLLE